MLVSLLEDEVTAFVDAEAYQRTPTRRDHRNGSYRRDLDTTVGRLEGLPIPRTRQGFRTNLFERYHRRQADLDALIGEMFIAGASTTQVGKLVETLNETQPSPSTVSRVFHTLEAELTAWKTRPLAEHYEYIFADGTYFTVIYEGQGVKMPILAVVGILPSGAREVLAFTVGEHENQTAWEDLLEDLKRRGVKDLGLIVTDGGTAMLAALAIKFPKTRRQRCVRHKMDNILSYVPETQRDAIEPELKAIFYQESREAADQVAAAFREKYQKAYPTALECMGRDWDMCLTFYAFPRTQWKSIRTNQPKSSRNSARRFARAAPYLIWEAGKTAWETGSLSGVPKVIARLTRSRLFIKVPNESKCPTRPQTRRLEGPDDRIAQRIRLGSKATGSDSTPADETRSRIDS